MLSFFHASIYFPYSLPFKYSARVIGKIQSSTEVAVSWVVNPYCLANLYPNDIEAPGCSETSVHLNYTTRSYSPRTAVFRAITFETTNHASMLNVFKISSFTNKENSFAFLILVRPNSKLENEVQCGMLQRTQTL